MSLQLLDLAAEAVTAFHHAWTGPVNDFDDDLTVTVERHLADGRTYIDVQRAPLHSSLGRDYAAFSCRPVEVLGTDWAEAAK